MDLRKKEWNDLDKFDLLQDRDRWVAVVSEVKRLRVT
jgi:hypothetical protein